MGKYTKFKGFTNNECEFFPCHQGVKRDFNCLFCYCPLLTRECPGPYKVFTDKYGHTRKDCSACTLPHDGIEQSWRFIQRWVSVSPNWDLQEQGNLKIEKWSKYVREHFDEADLKWAEDSLND
jgi:Zn-finger protein